MLRSFRIARDGLVAAASVGLLVAGSPLAAQGRRGGGGGRASAPPTEAAPARDMGPGPFVPHKAEDTLVVTHGLVRLNGAALSYTATTGMLPIRDQRTGDTDGYMFFVYYTKDGVTDPATRPITFLFNGGPGSATVWLHLGAFGPKRVKLNEDGTNPPPPYTWEDNPNTLLDQTDLVFLDPVGTGYSRAVGSNGPKFWGLDEDRASVAEFMRMFLTRYERWGSPRFLGGESYGTTRAAYLSGLLTDQGIGLNGVILISTVMNFESLRPAPGNDLPYIGFLPSFAMTAWYHHKVAAQYQAMPVDSFASVVRQFTNTEYEHALYAGNTLSDADKRAIAQKMSGLTGMPVAWLLDNDLRIDLGRFSTELLRDQHLMTGRLDSRFTAFNPDLGAEGTAFDASNSSIRTSFTPVLNDYVRRVLNYDNDNVYYILGGGIGPWRYPEGQYANVAPSLEHAFAANPYMKLYVAMGYYDMATVYGAVEYTLNHLDVSPEARKNITTDYFTAGHMMYIDRPSMTKLRADLRKFIDAGTAQH